MGMCRVILTDGTVMHLEAAMVGIDDGHLKICSNKAGNLRGAFAPGVWRYWIWVVMTEPA